MQNKNEDNQSIDPAERLLLESHMAKEGGVFDETPLSVEALLCEPIEQDVRTRKRRLLRWVPIAAAILLVCSVWTMMIGSYLREIRDGASLSRSVLAASDMASPEEFLACFDNSKTAESPGCRRHDYDNDGGINLADFAALQLANVTFARTQ